MRLHSSKQDSHMNFLALMTIKVWTETAGLLASSVLIQRETKAWQIKSYKFQFQFVTQSVFTVIPIQMLPTMFGNMDDLFKGKGEHVKNIFYPDETLII